MNENDFENSVRRNINTVIRLAVTYLKSYAEAEDTAQEVFLKLFTEHKTFANESEEKAWLIRVTINHCLNKRRSVWFSRTQELDEKIAGEMPDDELGVFEAVMKLPEKYRTVIHLYYAEDMSVKEISESCGIKESTVSTRLDRGRKQLKKLLEKGNIYEYGFV